MYKEKNRNKKRLCRTNRSRSHGQRSIKNRNATRKIRVRTKGKFKSMGKWLSESRSLRQKIKTRIRRTSANDSLEMHDKLYGVNGPNIDESKICCFMIATIKRTVLV